MLTDSLTNTGSVGLCRLIHFLCFHSHFQKNRCRPQFPTASRHCRHSSTDQPSLSFSDGPAVVVILRRTNRHRCHSPTDQPSLSFSEGPTVIVIILRRTSRHRRHSQTDQPSSSSFSDGPAVIVILRRTSRHRLRSSPGMK